MPASGRIWIGGGRTARSPSPADRPRRHDLALGEWDRYSIGDGATGPRDATTPRATTSRDQRAHRRLGPPSGPRTATLPPGGRDLMKTRVLLIASHPMGDRMAGPAIRYLEMARALSGDPRRSVTLAAPGGVPPGLAPPGVAAASSGARALTMLLPRADAVVTQGFRTPLAWLLLQGRPLVVDLYDPLPIEALAHHTPDSGPLAHLRAAHVRARTTALLERGDFFLAASDRQRDFWLGMLAARGRISGEAYAADPTLRGLIDTVPFGIPSDPPRGDPTHRRNLPEGIRPGDFLLVWGGGLWRWLDPATVVRAVGRAARKDRSIKALFLAGPPPAGSPALLDASAREIARTEGLLGKSVFFLDRWLPYAERGGLLAAAAAGVTAHPDTFESRVSFRTRVLDYLWASLPVVATSGDALGDLVEREELGVAVPPGDVRGMSEALLRLRREPRFAEACRRNVRRLRGRFRWSAVVSPLARFLEAPRRSEGSRGVLPLARFGAGLARALVRPPGRA